LYSFFPLGLTLLSRGTASVSRRTPTRRTALSLTDDDLRKLSELNAKARDVEKKLSKKQVIAPEYGYRRRWYGGARSPRRSRECRGDWNG